MNEEEIKEYASFPCIKMAGESISGPASFQSLADHCLAVDGVVTWIDPQHHIDVTSRKDLLMTKIEMIFQ